MSVAKHTSLVSASLGSIPSTKRRKRKRKINTVIPLAEYLFKFMETNGTEVTNVRGKVVGGDKGLMRTGLQILIALCISLLFSQYLSMDTEGEAPTGDWTQHLTHARQAFYQLIYIPRPEFQELVYSHLFACLFVWCACKDNLQKSPLLSLHHVGSRNRIQVARPGSRHFYQSLLYKRKWFCRWILLIYFSYRTAHLKQWICYTQFDI